MKSAYLVGALHVRWGLVEVRGTAVVSLEVGGAAVVVLLGVGGAAVVVLLGVGGSAVVVLLGVGASGEEVV